MKSCKTQRSAVPMKDSLQDDAKLVCFAPFMTFGGFAKHKRRMCEAEVWGVGVVA